MALPGSNSICHDSRRSLYHLSSDHTSCELSMLKCQLRFEAPSRLRFAPEHAGQEAATHCRSREGGGQCSRGSSGQICALHGARARAGHLGRDHHGDEARLEGVSVHPNLLQDGVLLEHRLYRLHCNVLSCATAGQPPAALLSAMEFTVADTSFPCNVAATAGPCPPESGTL